MNHIYCYRAFGFDFQSEIELPGIPAGDLRQRPAVSVRLGEVVHRTSVQSLQGTAYDVSDDEVYFEIENVGRYLVRRGREIVVNPADNATERGIRLFLLGSAFGALLHQKGLVPMHASSVRVGSGCVAFLGPSGAGKSTLCGFLSRRGHAILGDDICPIRAMERQVVAYPGIPRLKLWKQSIEALDECADELPRVRDEIDKFELCIQQENLHNPLPLVQLLLLRDCEEAHEIRIEPVSRRERLEIVVGNTYRLPFVAGLGLEKQYLRTLAEVTSSVPVYRLVRNWDLAHLPETVECLEEHFSQSSILAEAA